MPNPQRPPRTKDLKQQSLRDSKKRWSAEVSALISKLIEFKKGLNGRGSAKIGIEPSRIQNALPESVSANLQQLAGDFQKVVSDAEGIISAQQNYSATRRKRQPKKPKVPQPNVQAPAPAEAPMAPAPTEANPLASLSSFNAEIEKLASNRLTRFWEYLTSVFSRREYNRERLGMLSLSSKLFYDMLDFENSVLRTGEKTIPDTMNKFQNMKNTYIALRKLFESVAKTLADKASKEGVKPPQEEHAPVVEQKPAKPAKPEVINLDEESEDESDPNGMYINQIKHNINTLNNKKQVHPKDLQEIIHMINEYEKDKDPHTRDIWLKQIKEEYNNLLFALKNKQADIFNDNMIKVSHNALTRFLRKQLVKAKSYDKTAAPRLRAVDIATDAKKTTKRLMDVLEKDLSVEEVSKLLGEIENKIIEIGKLVSILSVLYKERFSGENHESDKDLDVALRRKVRRDLLTGMM